MSVSLPGLTPWIARVLRWGSYLSAALLLLGVVWMLLAPDLPLQVGAPMPLGFLAPQLAQGNPYTIMQLALLLLLATPLLRVSVAGVSFWVKGERRLTVLSLAVLALILLAVLLTGSR
ncbi:MAG: DUF1634 domain-containing protein [Terriglobia bacterium]